MTRKSTTLLTALLLLTASAASAERYTAADKIREVPDYHEVEVEIWTDRGEDSCYCAGEPIEIYFRTNVDAWVAIYDIDTRGETHRVFPTRHNRDNFVRGGEVHRVPSRYGHHFEVEGPAGWETLKAVASFDREAVLNAFNRHATGTYRPTRITITSRGGYGEKIREVPDHHPPYDPYLAVSEARHYVRVGHRCRPVLPWWLRR